MNFKLRNILNRLMKFLYTPFSPLQTMNHLSSIFRLYILPSAGSSAAILINRLTAMTSQLHVQGTLCSRLILKYILHHLIK